METRAVVLVRLRRPLTHWIMPPLGIGYLLKALGKIPSVRPVFLDAQREGLDDKALLDRIEGENPILVGIQVFSSDVPALGRVLPKLRSRLGKRVVLVVGGPHVTALPELTLRENPDLDFVIVGEGEESLPALIEAGRDASNLESIANLAYRRNGSVVRTETRWVDVEQWGAPDWERLGPEEYPALQHGTFHRGRKVAPILTSRGCPYPCTFCAGRLLTGRKIRLRSAQSIADEIELLQKRHGIEELLIEDENFTYHKHHVLSLTDELKRRGLRCWFSIPNGVRLDRLDEEVVARMADMGVYSVLLGIESGSPRTLRRMKKNWDLREVRRKIELLKRHGILVFGSFILGYHSETRHDLRKTMDLALRCKLDTAVFGNYIPLPGTEDFEILRASGELDPRRIDWGDYHFGFGKFPYCPPGISPGQLRREILRATARFYLRPRILWGMLKRVWRKPVYLKNLLFRVWALFLGS